MLRTIYESLIYIFYGWVSLEFQWFRSSLARRHPSISSTLWVEDGFQISLLKSLNVAKQSFSSWASLRGCWIWLSRPPPWSVFFHCGWTVKETFRSYVKCIVFMTMSVILTSVFLFVFYGEWLEVSLVS